jgi:glycosyltransferase involved in cell wall biosynthesis
MYCGACARDVALVRGLRARGHEVDVVPLYTPLRMEGEEPFDIAPVFLGGINLYLQQRSAFFRRIPAALDRVLNSAALLRLVSRFAISTKASELGEMTVSMLVGMDGLMRKEAEQFVAYLQDQPRPDVIVITNTMLSGLVGALSERLQAPIVAQVQGEDAFVGALPEPHATKAKELIRANVRPVRLFVSPNAAYAREMAGFLEAPEERVRVVRTGLSAEPYRRTQPREREPFTVGYLSGIAHGKGLDVLVEAMRELAGEQKRDVHLEAAGRVLDKAYWKRVAARMAEEPLAWRAEYVGELDFRDKLVMLGHCSVLCVPSRIAEVRGLVAMEAMAAGVPVVAPNAGVFPEMVSLTGGGRLFEPGDAGSLAEALAYMMDHPEEADERGRQGAEAIAAHYSVNQSAEGMEALLAEVVGG